jgi:hypothetical protein
VTLYRVGSALILLENEMPEYRDLEKLVARIQQQLAPKSKVIHNTKLRGRHTRRLHRQHKRLLPQRSFEWLVRRLIGL